MAVKEDCECHALSMCHSAVLPDIGPIPIWNIHLLRVGKAALYRVFV